MVFICFSKTFPQGEYGNLASFFTLLSSEYSISSPVRHSYLSIFLDDNADIFAASVILVFRL